MGFEVPVFILIGISFVFFLLGNCSPALTIGGFCEPVENLNTEIGASDPISDDVISQMINIFSDPVFLGMIGLATVSTILLGGNFTVNYIVPIFLIVVMLNFFVLPISFIFTASYDPTLKLLFGLLINSMLILTISEWVRR